MPAPAKVTMASDREVVVTRDFDAPTSLVYAAFTRPSLVSRWMLGPPGWTMPVCEIDLRVGGKYRYRWRSEAEGQEFGFTGEYLAIEPERRIEHVERFEGEENMPPSHCTLVFETIGQRTRTVYSMRFDSKEACEAALATGMTDGMEMSYQLLDKVLATNPPELQLNSREN
jgi:uncharacterized protein YndB with AHSA1/START domain